jgi:signal transduction histidine kinase
MAPRDKRAREPNAQPSSAPRETSMDRQALVDELRDTNAELVVGAMRAQELADQADVARADAEAASQLARLSAGLIHVQSSDLDSALERALEQVGTFLEADRGNLDEYLGDDAGLRISWARPGLEGPPQVMEAGQWPWTVARLARGDAVRFSRMDELPEEAAIDRASFERTGTRSTVLLPLRAGGPVLGVLSFDSVRAERAWPDELVERLGLLGEAFAGVLERKRMDLALAERLRFDNVLSALSVAFSRLPVVDFDREIVRGLQRVVDFLGGDRGSLIEFSRDGKISRSWAMEDWIDVGEFPWMAVRLRDGDIVSFSQLEELPDEAEVDRQSYLAYRVKPQVAVPLLAGGQVVGGLIFSTVGAGSASPDKLLEQLRLIGEVFANALSRKRADLEAQRLRQELTHVGRVSAMGELTASLAHELNQPLTAILSNAQVAKHLLGVDPVNLEEIGEILDDIVADDKRAAEVIRRLRALIKKGDLEYESLDLNEVVSEVTRLVRSDVASRNVSMSLELAPDLPKVHGDRVQLQQVVLNLVINSLEAMREPGAGVRTLVIRTARDDAAHVAVAVQDSGIGIDETAADRIFDPLYTTKPEGLGMGLAIARTIVDAHRGRLGAANNVHGGATFQFKLPVDAEAPR